METQTTEYPLQTEHLHKGSIIAAGVIEEAFQVKRGTDAYQMAVMRAIEYIARRLASRGEVVTVAQRKHDLVVLTDDEAIGHNAQQFKIAIRKARRSHTRQLAVDRSQVSTSTLLKEHDRNLEVGGHVISSISRATREITAAVRQRDTPALVAGKKR